MTVDEAEDLAVRITRTWPAMRVPADEWREVLADLDVGTSGTAYIRLRNEQPRPPSIAEFVTVYRALPTPSNLPIRRCPTCGGDGMITTQQILHGTTYDVFRPCPDCDSTDAQRVLHGIVSANNDELDRLIPGRTHAFHDLAPAARPRSDARAITFDAYVARLTQRAGMGDREAEEMLAVWDRNLARFDTTAPEPT